MFIGWPYPDEGYPYDGSGRDARDRRSLIADAAVAGDIAERLLGDPAVRAKRLEVVVQNRVAILEGEVDSLEVREAAARHAWATPGVFDVLNLLRT